MPIRINEQMPVVKRLEEEQIFVMHESRAASQDIRELEIAVLNIMPDKEDTELQLLRLLSNTPLQVKPTFLRLDSHLYKHVTEDYLQKYYRSFSAVKDRCFDGLIITGAAMGINWILLFEAYNYTTVAVATLCYYMEPTIVILLSPFLFQEPLCCKQQPFPV